MPKFGDPDFIDPKEAGKLGGERAQEVRLRREGLDPLVRARQEAERDADKAVKILKDAAQGKGGFEDLDLIKRVDAAKAWLNIAGLRTTGNSVVVPTEPDAPQAQPGGYIVEEADASQAPSNPGEVHPGRGDL